MRDYGDLEGLNCDCLGCLIEARDTGAIDDDILHEITATPTEHYVTCPVCANQAYLSTWAEVAHCSSCGWYLIPENGAWLPFRQGLALNPKRNKPVDTPSPATE